MTAFLQAGFLAGLVAILVTYPGYFFKLAKFRDTFHAHFPEAWKSSRAAWSGSDLQLAYKVLREVRGGTFEGSSLPAGVEEGRRSATRWLYAAVASFLLAVLSWLGNTLIAEMGW